MPTSPKTVAQATATLNKSFLKMEKAIEDQSEEVNRRVSLFNKVEESKDDPMFQLLNRIEEKLDTLERKIDFIF